MSASPTSPPSPPSHSAHSAQGTATGATGTTAVPAADAPATDRDQRLVPVFVQLKLRLLRNGLRQSTGRRVAYVTGTLVGVLWSILILAGLLLVSGDKYAPDAIIVLFPAIALGWAFLPLFFSGGDETVDPTRLALLPVRPRPLMSGLLAASLVGPGPVVTSIILAGGPAVLGRSPASIAVGVAASLLTLMFCVVLSRAVTAANARLLSSRRGRDLAVLSGVVVVIGIQVANLALQNVSRVKSLSGLRPVADVVRWIPPGSAAHAIQASRAGDWGIVVLDFAITVAALILATRWWYICLNRLMVTRDASTIAAAPGETVKRSRASGLARYFPEGRVGAVMGRQFVYAFRDPRAKMAWVIALFMGALLPVILSVQGAASPYLICFSSIMLGMQSFNQFGVDGPSFWTTMLATGTRADAFAELRGRAMMSATVVIPFLLVIAIALGITVGHPTQIAVAAGLGLAIYGVLTGIASVISVLMPYSMPQSGNPMQTVAPGQNGLAAGGSIAGMVSSIVLGLPVLLAAVGLNALGSGWQLLVLPIGVAYGFLFAWLGLRTAARRMLARLPEILAAVGRG